MGLESTLLIGKQSLLVNQAALQTIGHNIANAGVEGYSRQEIVLASNPNTERFLGAGVRVETVRQKVDRYLNDQIARFKSNEASLAAQAEGVQLADAFLNESGIDGGINGAINNFFAAAEDLATSPEGAAERNGLINSAETLVGKFNRLGRSIEGLQAQVDQDIGRAIKSVNLYAQRIATLNSSITTGEVSGNTENDLRDERQRNIESLSEQLGTSVLEEENGASLVIVANSVPLIARGIANKLVGIQDPDNVVGDSPPTALKRVIFEDKGNSQINITSRVTGGKIGGLIEFRDKTLKNLLAEIDTIAATIVNEVNKIHRQGFGLDGSTNLDFFQPLALKIQRSSSNSTDAVTGKFNVQSISANSKIFDSTALTMSDYKIEFETSATFTITDTDTDVKLNATQVSIDGGPLGTDSAVTTFNLIGGSVTAEFEGIRAAIQKFSGDPKSGDSFNISIRKGAAKSLAFNKLLVADNNKLATAGTPDSPGDNTSALAFADLRGKAVVGRGVVTISGYLNNIFSNFGALGEKIIEQHEVADQIKSNLSINREAVSGVSLDEELAAVILYQQNFGASAKMISTVSLLLQQIMDLL